MVWVGTPIGGHGSLLFSCRARGGCSIRRSRASTTPSSTSSPSDPRLRRAHRTV